MESLPFKEQLARTRGWDKESVGETLWEWTAAAGKKRPSKRIEGMSAGAQMRRAKGGGQG
jgi:hypothetical protein